MNSAGSEIAPVGVTAENDVVSLGRRLGEELSAHYLWWSKLKGDTERVEYAAEEAAKKPLAAMTWSDLAEVGESDSELAVELWREMVAESRRGLESGWHAANVIRRPDTKPIDHARFVALRESLYEEWRPRNGIEWSLIDALAQAITMKERAIRTLIERETSAVSEDIREADIENTKNRDKYLKWREWFRPRITVQEAINEANADIERWDRIMVRTLRQLRDLRRFAVTINNQGQVNVGEQQVNGVLKLRK